MFEVLLYRRWESLTLTLTLIALVGGTALPARGQLPWGARGSRAWGGYVPAGGGGRVGLIQG